MGKNKKSANPLTDKAVSDKRMKAITSLRSKILSEKELDNFDRTAPQYTRDIKKLAEEMLKDGTARMKKVDGFDPMESFKFSYHYMKRRVSAIVKYAPMLADKYESKCTSTNIERAVMETSTMLSGYMPDTEEDVYISLAIAIYILDDLYENKNIWEAMLYIPDSKELLCDVDIPDDFCDAVYETDVIKGMIYLIENRDGDDDIYLSKASAKRTAETVKPREYIESAVFKSEVENAKERCSEIKAEAENMTCRERLEKILSYMNPETVERAEKHFEEKVFELVGYSLEAYDRYSKKYAELVDRAVEYCDEIIKLEKRIAKLIEEEHRNERVTKPAKPSVLAMKMPSIQPEIPLMSDVIGRPRYHEKNEIEMVYRKIGELAEGMDKLDDERHHYIMGRIKAATYFYNCNVGVTFYDDVEEEREKIKSFRINNPYEICFAYFSLLESGSDLVWLVEPSASVLFYATELLPWVKDYNEILDDIYGCEQEETEKEANDYDEQDRLLYATEYTDYTDWHDCGVKRVYKEDLLHINFPQFVYRETGLNMPRRMKYSPSRDKGLIKSGISKKNVDMFKLYLSLCRRSALKIDFPTSLFTDDIEIENVDNSAELKNIISSKSDEIVQLKVALHKAENEVKNEKKKAEKLLNDTEMERRELNELRELIYKLQNNTEDEAFAENDEISLPYTAKSNIIIFGGHASWLRAVRPLLNGVRIIDPYTNPDINLIRNADVVWMQTNAMPHSYYNKIMEIVRARKIPVKYFAYASAEKCARQLAAYDMEEK